MEKKKVLFILKRREDYSGFLHSYIGLSTGLYNSAQYMNQMLKDAGVDSELEVAIDNNCIDRLVTKHKPSHVIIEALWVVPKKFEVLTKLHPTVEWIVRLHSEVPFIAMEGIATAWIYDYLQYPRMKIGINSPRLLREVREYLKNAYDWSFVDSSLIYMPNFYPVGPAQKKKYVFADDEIHISCFGSIRPLKNHLTQAIAAVEFANLINKKLVLHINGNRVEQKGDPILNNLREMFKRLALIGPAHRLVEHDWLQRDDFVRLCSTMDIGMQVSFSETFNIVGADHVGVQVPLIGSQEIPWLSQLAMANPTHTSSIVSALMKAYKSPELNVGFNRRKLRKYSDQTKKVWLKYFR